MKSRTVLWIVLALLFAAGVGGVVFAVVNFNAYLRSQKPNLEATASKLLARDVRFDDIGVAFADGLGIRVSNPWVSDDPAYSEEAFLSADAIEVSIGIRAALDGNVEIRSAVLVAPVLRLHHHESGWNFDSLGESADDDPASQPPSDPGEPDPREIVISLLDATNGTVFYTNTRGGAPYTIEATRIELSAEEWRPGEPFLFDGKAVLHGADSHNTQIAASVHPKPSGPAKLDIEVKLMAHRADRILALPPVAALFPKSARASGPVHANLKLTGPTSALGFDAHVDVGEVGFVSDAYDKPADAPLDLHARGKIHAAAFDVVELHVRGPRISGTASGTLQRSKPPILNFQLRSDAIPLDALGLHRELVPPESREFEILRKVQGSGKLTLTAGAPPRGKLRIRSDSGFLRGVGYQQMDVALTLSNGPLRATSRFAGGELAELPFSNIHFDLVLDDGRVQLERGTADFLGGQLTATGETQPIDGARKTSLSARLEGARAERLGEALRPSRKGNAEGKLSAYVDLTGSGSAWEELRGTLAATGAITLDEGVLHRVNLAKGAVDAITAIPGLASVFTHSARQQNPEVFDASTTEFERIEIRFQVADGLARTDEIEIKTTGYKIVGQGQVSLLGVVDANAILTFSESVTGKMGRSGKLLGGLMNPAGLLAVPVRLVGTLPNVETKADPAHIARAIGKGLLLNPMKGLMGGADSLFGGGSKPKQKLP